MGWTQRRRTKNGGVRYRACYRDLRGQIQAAGTFSTEREADRAWQRAETRLASIPGGRRGVRVGPACWLRLSTFMQVDGPVRVCSHDNVNR